MTTSALPRLGELLDRDLDYICGNLRDEIGRMAGKNLLITGGAGFLGYYLVLAALHWNKKAGAGSQIQLTVYDNFARGTPAWLTALEGDPNLRLRRHDMIQPLPADIDDFHYIIHAAGIASPIYYRKYPLQDHRRQHQRPAQPARLQRAPGRPRASRWKAFCSIRRARSTAIRPPGDPDPRGLPRQRLVHRTARVLRRVQALRRDDLRHLRASVRRARRDRPAVQQLRAGAEDHRRPGAAGLRARRAPRAGSRHVLRTARRRGPSATARTRSRATTRCSSRVTRASRYNIGTERPEISIARACRTGHRRARDELFDYRGQLVRKANVEADYLVDNPNRRCPVIDKARRHLGYDRACPSTKGCGAPSSGITTIREAEEA